MGYREVRMYEVREVLRLFLAGESLHEISRMTDMDRKTVRRYVGAANSAGLDQNGGEEQLTDELLGQVAAMVRPTRTDGHGPARRSLDEHADEIRRMLDDEGLTVKKAHSLLSRRGLSVSLRTFERFCAELCGPRRARKVTVCLADSEPGDELQMDFGRMGLVFDSALGRRRVCHALVFTACVSRHTFVWLSFSQTTKAVIAGCEAAWEFFGGVFRTVIPDNMSPVVDKADPLEPRLNEAFIEYAQVRGFFVDAARVRRPQDKAKVERAVAYVRQSFFAGEHFVDLGDAQRRAVHWCRNEAGLRARDDGVPASRALRRRRAAGAAQCSDKALRRAALREGEGAPGPLHRGRKGAVLDADGLHRQGRRRPGRLRARAGVCLREAR
jgi:transposase